MPLPVWTSWVVTSTTNTTTSITADNLWRGWNQGTATTFTTNIWTNWTTNNVQVIAGNNLHGVVWGQWLYQPVQPLVHQPQTPEQIRQAEAQARAQRLTWERAEKKRKREEAAAQKKAEKLLLEHLTPEQADEYRRLKLFHVIAADGKLYRIKRGWSHNLELIEEGQAVKSLCVHPNQRVPEEDNLLAQKLWLESDPAELNRIAIARRIA